MAVPEALVTRPMTWESVGTWIDAEGYASYYYEDGILRVEIIMSQANKVTTGYQILENIRNFIKNQLGIEGKIYPKARVRAVFRLTYHKILDCYKLAVPVLPYLRHPKMIRSMIRIIIEIEAHTLRTIARYEAKLPQVEPRLKGFYKALITKQYQRLAEIQRIKQEYPYIQELKSYPPLPPTPPS